MEDIFYTLEYYGERLDWQCESEAKLRSKADEWFADKFEDEPMRNGETRIDDAVMIKYTHDEGGEYVELERSEYPLYYEYYHGDLAEHGTYF